jgi:hypothetical protein
MGVRGNREAASAPVAKMDTIFETVSKFLKKIKKVRLATAFDAEIGLS